MKKLKFFLVIVLLTCNSVGAQLTGLLMQCCCKIPFEPIPGAYFQHCWMQSDLLPCCREFAMVTFNSYVYNSNGISLGFRPDYVDPSILNLHCPGCIPPPL